MIRLIFLTIENLQFPKIIEGASHFKFCVAMIWKNIYFESQHCFLKPYILVFWWQMFYPLFAETELSWPWGSDHSRVLIPFCLISLLLAVFQMAVLLLSV